MRVTYLFLFEDDGALSNIRSLIVELEWLLHMHVLVCASQGSKNRFFQPIFRRFIGFRLGWK